MVAAGKTKPWKLEGLIYSGVIECVFVVLWSVTWVESDAAVWGPDGLVRQRHGVVEDRTKVVVENCVEIM